MGSELALLLPAEVAADLLRVEPACGTSAPAADLRQRGLIRMLSPQPRLEAYDCQCDMDSGFAPSDNDCRTGRRSHLYVLVEG